MLLPLVLSTWILSSATSADNLQCLQCANSTHATCKGKIVTCSETDTACVSYYEKVTVGVKETTLFMMMCGTCDTFKPTTVRFHKGIVKSNSTCCTDSYCTPPEPTIAPYIPPNKDEKTNDKLKVNRLICKSCYTSAKSCDCNTVVNCTGQESICIHRYTIVTGSHNYLMAVRGCTTNHTCSVPPLKKDKTKPFTITSEYTCSSSNILHHSPLPLLFPAVFLLLFLRPFMS